MKRMGFLSVLVLVCLWHFAAPSAQEQLIRAELVYRGADSKPAPNFQAPGRQVPLTLLPASAVLPAGAVAPARSGVLPVGLNESSWFPLLLAADAAAPQERCRLFLDLNRNGNFADDGDAIVGTIGQDQTGKWRNRFDVITLTIGRGLPEPFALEFFTVSPTRSVVPPVIDFTITSWRSGSVMINGVPAVVAAMDFSRDGVFGAGDLWSVLGADEPNSPAAVLRSTEMLATNQLMFVPSGGKALVLEFRSFTPDGKFVTFAVVNRPVTKAEYRAAASLSPADRVATVWTETVPDLMRACGTEVKAALVRRAQAEVAKGTAQAAADDVAKTWLVTYSEGIAADEVDRITSRRAAAIERAKTGNPYTDQALMMCMFDRRLAQISGGLVTGLKGGSSKGPGGQR